MAFVKRGKVNCDLFGCTITYVERKFEPRGRPPENKSMRKAGNYSIKSIIHYYLVIEEQHNWAFMFNNKVVIFTVENDKAKISEQEKHTKTTTRK